MRRIACALLLFLCACKSPLWIGKSDACHTNSDCALDAYCDAGVCASTITGPTTDLGGACITSADCPAGDGGSRGGDAASPGSCTNDCDCDPVHSVGCEGGHCAAVARLLVCCGIPNPPGWVKCLPYGSDGGTATTSCTQAGGQCMQVGATMCPASSYACPPGLCCIGASSTFACNMGSCDSTAQYCYGGAETGFYIGPGTIQIGCDNLPPDCSAAPSCACLLSHYQAGFCTCAPSGSGFTVHCSFA
jgi:hypothetical protein